MKALTERLVILLFLAAGAANLAAQEASPPPDSRLLPAVEAFFNGREAEASRMMEELRSQTGSSTWEDRLLQGRISLWLGRIELARGRKDKAEELLLDAAEKAATLQQGRETAGKSGKEASQVYCLEADARAEIMLIKGVAFIIRNAGKVQELAEKALELDPENPAAGVIFAQGKINAPRLFGGNRNEGLERLNRIWNRRPGGNSQPVLSKPHAFLVSIALGDALAEKEPEKAGEFYREALAWYPGSTIGRERLERLKK